MGLLTSLPVDSRIRGLFIVSYTAPVIARSWQCQAGDLWCCSEWPMGSLRHYQKTGISGVALND